MTLIRFDAGSFSAIAASSNMAFNLAPLGRRTLRDKAAQHRLALRWALPLNNKECS